MTTEYFIGQHEDTVIELTGNLIKKATVIQKVSSQNEIIYGEVSLTINHGNDTDIRRIRATYFQCDGNRYMAHLMKIVGAAQSEVATKIQELYEAHS
jgi:hypothetical protein